MTPDDKLIWLPPTDIRKLVAAFRGLIALGVITDQAGLSALLDRLANAEAIAIVERI
jgi:hypothetical protein